MAGERSTLNEREAAQWIEGHTRGIKNTVHIAPNGTVTVTPYAADGERAQIAVNTALEDLQRRYRIEKA
jgi:hypothetical protein